MPSLLFGFCAFTIICSVVLGGGTRGGFLSDGVLQFLSLPLLLVSLWRIFDLKTGAVVKGRPFRWELLFCGAIVLVPLVQLIPLPPSIWSALPGRKPVVFVFDLLGGAMPWMPISVSPEATWLSLLSLLPPVAIFLGCLLLSYRERRLLSLVLLAVGLVCVFVGLLQVSQGPSSPLRFFEFTNTTEAVGFFANRNHLAALLYSLMLLVAAWAVDSTFTVQSRAPRNDAAAVIAIVASFTILIILVSAQAMARSRAGLGLTIVAMFGAFALAYSDRRALRSSDRRGRFGLTPTKLLLAATTLAVMFAVQFTLLRTMERFTVDPMEGARVPIARNTIAAAKAYMPFGSGMGSFVPVYGMYEQPQDAMINTYANHAHNDFLEVWLESGVVGIVLIGSFMIWFVLKSLKVWRRPPPGRLEIDQALARAATLMIGLLLAHSFVDYPLRTGAMMAALAFTCALLTDPPNSLESTASNTGEKTIRRRQAGPPRPSFASAPRRSASATISSWQRADLVGENVKWPDEWRKPVNHVPPNFNG